MERETLPVLLEIVAHAILSDNELHPKQVELYKKLVKVLGVEKELPEGPSQLPPLESLIKKLDTKIKQIEALSLCMDAITANGKLDENEEAFLRKFCLLLGLKESAIDKYVEVAKSLAKARKDFYLFLEEEYFDKP